MYGHRLKNSKSRCAAIDFRGTNYYEQFSAWFEEFLSGPVSSDPEFGLDNRQSDKGKS